MTTTLLLTGASGGLGRATTLEAARRGARLILLGRKAEALIQLADAVAAVADHDPLLHVMDLAKAEPQDYAELMQLIAAHTPCLDGLLHLAADVGAPAPLAHVDPTSWNRLLRINLSAPFLLTRACLPLLKPAAGKVVFVGDPCALAYLGAYAVAKAGLARQAEQWAEEQPGIQVELFNAPPMPTALRARIFPGEDPRAAHLTAVEQVACALLDRLIPPAAAHVQDLANGQ